MMPFALIPLATPTVNIWDHSVPQRVPLTPVVTSINMETPSVLVPSPVVVHVAGPPKLVRSRMKVRIPKQSTQQETLLDLPSDTEPSDAENIDENEERSDDSGSEGSLKEFLNHGEVTESDYSSSDSETEREDIARRKNASKRLATGTTKPIAITRRIVDSDSD